MKLSEFELDVMRLFWEHGELTTPEICEIIMERRPVARNTIKTIVHRLEEKGAIERVHKEGRTLIFAPMVSRGDQTESTLPNFLERFFSGSPKRLVSHLIDEKYLSEDDLKELQSMHETKQKKKKKQKPK